VDERLLDATRLFGKSPVEDVNALAIQIFQGAEAQVLGAPSRELRPFPRARLT